VIVLDSVGIGAAPDADEYGDAGTHTLCHTLHATGIELPTLTQLGLGTVETIDCLPAAEPHAALARLAPLSAGKDTITGHWELMGQVTRTPFPTYPDGFPPELLEALSAACGRGIIGNRSASGTQIIDELGLRHLQSGALIVYTSADSVLQIAAHEDVVPVAELYECCRAARRLCSGEHAVARVIARPFVGEPGQFRRTERRADFSLPPPHPLALDLLADEGVEVLAVGKLDQVFGGRGISRAVHTVDNADGMRQIAAGWTQAHHQLVIANLVDFDMVYGHRNNVEGYGRALAEFDAWLGEFLPGLSPDEACVITADHGCDPTTGGTDHTREYVPMIVAGPRVRPGYLGTIAGFGFVGHTLCRLLGVDDPWPACGRDVETVPWSAGGGAS